MALPTKHLSARVPWHDNRWNGTYCCKVHDNSFCRAIPRIDDAKDAEAEFDGENFRETHLPPCLEEKGAFLSPREFSRPLVHRLRETSPMYKDHLPGQFLHKAYSFSAVPYLWMMKEKDAHSVEKAQTYGLDYWEDLEEAIEKQLGYHSKWVQDPHNQQVMLDSFFSCLKPRESLVFFYSKHTPLSEPNERVIVGVARVRRIGALEQFRFPEGYAGYRSHAWDRCIEHALTPTDNDGLLLPYHDLLTKIESEDLDPREFLALAPDHAQFSYSSELVEHDTAIDALWRMAEVLRKSAGVLGRSFDRELEWINNEVSRLWDMRGGFPGMGPVLTAMRIAQGNAIAWELERHIRKTDPDLLHTDPWQLFEASIQAPESVLGSRGKELFSLAVQRIWKTSPAKKKVLLQFFSRIQLNQDQADLLVNQSGDLVGAADEILGNPYLIYERLRVRYPGLLSIQQVDKAIFPPIKVRQAFPLPETCSMEDALDDRRSRAMTVWILEEAADQGHSLVPLQEVCSRLETKGLTEEFPIGMDVLLAQTESDFFSSEVILVPSDDQKFLKLKRLAEAKRLITLRINREMILNKPHSIELDWAQAVKNHIVSKGQHVADSDPMEKLALGEKAAALKVLCQSRVSVLIGPAGSGKTTLLEVFERIPEIEKGGLIKLAPTGKARVRMGLGAKTVAQFLSRSGRYLGDFNVYTPNDNGPKDSTARNLIVDESSMLTEEQLAAILDALGPMDRIILVGDYRQLPPIGTGRPFVDIVRLLRPISFADQKVRTGPGYAELRQIRRQKGEREDISLSRCFGDTQEKVDLDAFLDLASGLRSSSHVRLEKWYNNTDFRPLFERVLREELGLDPQDLSTSFNRCIGATDFGDYQYFNRGQAERTIERWQILSPVNGYGHGVKELNKSVQTTFRKSFIDLAHSKKEKSVAKPKGADNMVYGDKVISLRNATWKDSQWIVPFEAKSTALNYFANGEIGVITGKFESKKNASYKEPNVEITFSTQPGYSYSFRPSDLGEEGKYPFELAYAITVHKAQGSGFGTVFFVLPSSGPILCRELLYTALTRQESKIVILHQGDFRDFLRYADSQASATARRYTDLFDLPQVQQIQKKYYDSRYINISQRGERMISKSEVIIANCLNAYRSQLSYAYEDKLVFQELGRAVSPDFKIEHLGNGRVFYWEHLGMMTNDRYREKWQKKLEAYRQEGFIPFMEATSDNDKVLIITEENPNGGIDSQRFVEIIEQVILKD